MRCHNTTDIDRSDWQKSAMGREKCLKVVEDTAGTVSSTQLRMLTSAINAVGCTHGYQCVL